MKTLQELREIIWRKAEVNEQYYTADDIKFDINQEYKNLFMIASATGRGITRKTEEIIIDKDTTEYTRIEKGDTIIKLELKHSNLDDTHFKCIKTKQECDNKCYELGLDWDYEKIVVKNPRDNLTLRITYLHEDFIPLENDDDTPAEWIEDFEDLLWLEPVMEQNALYKPERYEYYMKRYDTIYRRFEQRFPLKSGKVSFKEDFNY